MTAPIKGKLTCVSHSATNFPEPNATREELDAAAVRLNLLAEAEMYSTDAVMTMVEADTMVVRGGERIEFATHQTSARLVVMAILGIGVDVLHLPRLTRHLADNRLARRILSRAELCEYLALPEEDHGKRIRFLGVRCALLPPLARVQWFKQSQMGSKRSRVQGGVSHGETHLARFYAEEMRKQSQARPGVSP